MRAAVPDGVNAAVDTAGTDEAIDVSLALVSDHRRIATIVAFDRAEKNGIKGLRGSPGSDKGGIEIRNAGRLRLAQLTSSWDQVFRSPT